VNSLTVGQSPSVLELFYRVTRFFNSDETRLHNDYRHNRAPSLVSELSMKLTETVAEVALFHHPQVRISYYFSKHLYIF
jgi:hypothetical protein